MATATILNVYCVRPSSGTDEAVNEAVLNALANLSGSLPFGEVGASIEEFLGSLPEVITAIDTAGDYPDDFFLTTSTDGALSNGIWPLDDDSEPTTVPLRASQSSEPYTDVSVGGTQNLSLWDRDPFPSGNDHLGAIQLLGTEAGEGEKIKLAKNSVHGSAYYVTYRVE
ncbi:hypothetical protein STRCI_000029 [Streptomyces cinnabarinus]|uniref:Uncharacterized protein n=1 Tax=Streptomyces cinnabarinus TaxID=67287 RepID=A0ABY7K779_9ACTN|nr:hypothetical protein [Streptomyces cinnabarinus]WAZ19012.1 hypothetical protein STRCI_000029 [Streptomyces cinnabarinus]